MPASIFISIAAYRDPLLPFTVGQALATARAPDALRFGVVDQAPAAEAAEPALARQAGDRLRYLRLEPAQARGPCWARAVAMSLYDGEDWFFQIDSHMSFGSGWDEQLVAHAQPLQAGRAGAVVSSYPDRFHLDAAGSAVHAPSPAPLLAHVVRPGAAFEAGHPVLPFEAQAVAFERPLAGFHLGAGCLFAPGRFALAFPYDPAFYFHGEEQALALRLFTHGWDIFHVPRLPVFHLYNDGASGAPPRPMHWDEPEDAGRAERWWLLEARSRRRLQALVDGAPLGAYGLGTARTLAQYALFSGIDYAQRRLAPYAFQPHAWEA